MKFKFRNIFLCFMLYCFVGWIYETVLEVFIYHWGFSNRGVLFGPYLPVYGFGALIFILAFNKSLKELKPVEKLFMIPTVFITCMLIATGVELITSYICEFLIGSFPWNYDRFMFNFQGRIAPNPSIRFGIGSIIILYIIEPIFEKIVRNTSEKKLNLIFLIAFLCIFRDLFYKIISMIC